MHWKPQICVCLVVLDFAGINVLCGVGILSTPYAAKEGGWLGLSILFIFGILSFYTGLLLRSCLDSEPGLETYPDIGQAAFGTAGRIAISVSRSSCSSKYSYLWSFPFFIACVWWFVLVSNLNFLWFLLFFFFVWMQIVLYVELYVSTPVFTQFVFHLESHLFSFENNLTIWSMIPFYVSLLNLTLWNLELTNVSDTFDH